MFTPPPSPTPNRIAPRESSPSGRVSDNLARSLFRDASPTPSPASSSSLMLATTSSLPDSTRSSVFKLDVPQDDIKKRVGRRTTWIIIVAPVILILITLSTRYLTHPVALDMLSVDRVPLSWSSVGDWQVHKRHPEPDPQQNKDTSIIFPTPTSSGGSSASSQPSSTSSGSQPIPTVPAARPALPTPFPQPLDTSLSQNFSTQGCQNFFANMTQTEPFRECRPFSLLQRSSSAFIQAQTNLSALNTIVWGTCNTDENKDTCNTNMAWFRDTLQAQCSQELSAKNAMVTNTLRGLQAYSLLRDTACLIDQSTDSYCYIEAVRNTNPSDLYFYQLPLGTSLPSDVTPSCSACTKSVMQLYAQANNLTGLASTYNNAAQIADKACGDGYVQQASIVGGAASLRVLSGWTLVFISTIMTLVMVGL